MSTTARKNVESENMDDTKGNKKPDSSKDFQGKKMGKSEGWDKKRSRDEDSSGKMSQAGEGAGRTESEEDEGADVIPSSHKREKDDSSRGIQQR